MPRDPVCGMEVKKDTPYKLEMDGMIYYFCSEECADEFVYDIDEYGEPVTQEDDMMSAE